MGQVLLFICYWIRVYLLVVLHLPKKEFHIARFCILICREIGRIEKDFLCDLVIIIHVSVYLI